MNALSVKQPWAGLIGSGQKTIETRTWYTTYRGDLLICSSQKRIDPNKVGMHYYNGKMCFYLGSTICLVKVVDCVQMKPEHEKGAMCPVYEDAWAWILEDVRLVKQLPVKGQLSIYEVDYTYEDLKP